MAFSFIESPSPNFNDRPAGISVDTIIIHYTGMKTAEDALARLSDPAAEVSAHYLINESGDCHQLVNPDKRAWHAGVSSWQGRDNLNHSSIGIELVNPGHEFGYQPFPERQIDTLLHLLQHLSHYQVPVHRYLGHSDIAPTRKQDPGELFPWRRLADAGYGVMPKADGSSMDVVACEDDEGIAVTEMKKAVAQIGFSIPPGDRFCTETKSVIEALQRHWRPSAVNGVYDAGTQQIVMEITDLFGVSDIIAP